MQENINNIHQNTRIFNYINSSNCSMNSENLIDISGEQVIGLKRVCDVFAEPSMTTITTFEGIFV